MPFWPFSAMSQSTAALLFNIANVFLLVATFGLALATFVVWQTGIAKEKYWDHERLDAEQRVAALNLQAEKLRADNIQLQSIMVPRRWLGPWGRGSPTPEGVFEMGEQRSTLLKYAKTPVLIQVVPDFEAQTLANDMIYGLRLAGWDPRMIDQSESHISPIAIPEGVAVWSGARGVEGTGASWDAAEALCVTLSEEGISSADPSSGLHFDKPPGTLFFAANDIRNSVPAGTVVILIGMRPAFLALWRMESERRRRSDTH